MNDFINFIYDIAHSTFIRLFEHIVQFDKFHLTRILYHSKFISVWYVKYNICSSAQLALCAAHTLSDTANAEKECSIKISHTCRTFNDATHNQNNIQFY